MREDVYCTLLLNDSYLPGAQVLAHSLRDGGTTKRLAVMVTLSGVSQDTVTELKKLYDYVIPVEPIYSQPTNNLHLMKRPDLKAALTKIQLWNQTQFRKVVYVDADIVAIRTPDELFDVEAEFAASPDIGWPDCFNSGMMVTSPNKKTYDDLIRLASEGATFDGADQGLLNQYFANWHRLPFTYNCTVGGNMAYQYAPAFNHYGHNVSMVHFIGDQKPWDKGNVPGLPPSSGSDGPYDRLSGHWWSVWNKHHYGNSSRTESSTEPSFLGVGRTAPANSSSNKSDKFALGHSSQGEASGSSDSLRQNDAQTSSTSGAQSDAPTPETTITQQLQTDSVNKADSPPVAPAAETSLGSEDSPAPGNQTKPDSSVDHEPKPVPIRSTEAPSRNLEGLVPKPTQEPQQHPVIVEAEELIPASYDAPQTRPYSHYEEYISGGKFGEFVMTADGPIPQEQYFQTGAWSYHVQPSWPENQPALESQPSTAYEHWDPTRAGPPIRGAPEAQHLRLSSYANEWDKKREDLSGRFASPAWEAPATKPIFPWEQKPRQVTRVFMDPPASEPEIYDDESSEEEIEQETPAPVAPAASVEAPALKPVFPWEERPRTVTRVFDDQVHDTPSESAGDVSEARSDANTWRRLSGENSWDSNPAIRDYILGLRKFRIKSNNLPADNESHEDAPPPVRRTAPTWMAGRSGEEQEWDPEKKLEELRRLPTSFIAQLMAKNTATSSEGMQTDSPTQESGQSKHILSRRALSFSPIYSNSSTQTEPINVADKGVQHEFNAEQDDTVCNYDDGSITSTIDMRYRTMEFDSDMTLKTMASIPMERERSLDSALGSAFSDE